MSRRPLTDKEAELWRHATRDVTPLKETAAPASGPRPRTIRIRLRPMATAGSLLSSPPPVTAPFNRSWKRQLTRGEIEVAAVLDLHGLTESAAHQRLQHFLLTRARGDARAQDRVVLVITGKGRGGEGLLRRRLPHWLNAADLAGLVAGFFPAHVRHGGGGAFYVVLRRGRGPAA